MKRTAVAILMGVLVVAVVVVWSRGRAVAIADEVAGVPQGVAVRGATHLWRLQRDGWPSARWVWTVDYGPRAPDRYAEAQVYVSPGGAVVGQYNVAALRR